MTIQDSFTAFADNERIANGDLFQVANVVQGVLKEKEPRTVLVFSDQTGKQVDIDLREISKPPTTKNDELADETPPEVPEPRGPGRPKLGVVGKEITLLPRHWEWLNIQPGGPSVVLRKLVEQARLASKDQDRIRQSRDAVYHFCVAIAGNEPGFEEASRALFAGDGTRFDKHTQDWPKDVRDYVQLLAKEAFSQVEKP